MSKVVTSIRVDKELWRKIKHYALDKGITLTELLERLLKEELEKGEKKHD
jgi:predicted DNA-binding ribbon-helix-helix protein